MGCCVVRLFRSRCASVRARVFGGIPLGGDPFLYAWDSRAGMLHGSYRRNTMKDNRSEQAGAGRTAPARDGRRAGTSRNVSPAAVCDRTRGAQRPAQPRRRVPDTAYAPRQTAPRPAQKPAGRPVPARRAGLHNTSPHSRQIVVLLAAVLAVLLLITGSLLLARKVIFLEREPVAPSGDDIPNQPPETGNPIATPGSHPFADGPTGTVTFPFAADSRVIGKNSIRSARAVMVDLSAGEVVASRLADEKMYPASMTKIMTLIVAVENLSESVSLSYKVTVSSAVYEAMRLAGSSGMGLEAGEQLTVEALLYLTALQSDGIAASELARYIAGDEASFVQLMNRKASAMGLTNTHFANPTGLQDEANYSTCRDMAAILSYAMRMSLCRRILTTDSYNATCTKTTGRDAGYSFTYYVSNKFLTLLSQADKGKPDSLTMTAGKTGYAGNNSGFCLASYAVGADGHAYICVTSQATGSDGYLTCIRDHVSLYNAYAN